MFHGQHSRRWSPDRFSLLRSLPSLQSFDPLPGVDHVPEVDPVAAVVCIRMRAPHGLAPHRIEDRLIAKDLRRRVADASMLNQELRALRGLVGRACRRQPQPARVLLLLRKQPMISSSEISVIEGDNDIRGADREAGRLDLRLSRRPRHERQETERFKAYTYDELIQRDKLS